MTIGAETADVSGAGVPDLGSLLTWARRRAPALGAALAVNLVLVSLVAFTTRARPVPENPPVEVFLVAPPVMEQARKPRPATAAPLARPRDATPRPDAPAPEVRPLPLPPPVNAPPSRWGVQDDRARPIFGDLDRAVVPDIRIRRDCMNGRLDRMSVADRQACERRLSQFKPNGTPKPEFALKDPNGDWARAAKRQEDRRKPLTEAPVHACRNDRAMNNLASGCTD